MSYVPVVDPDEVWAYSPNLRPRALPELQAAWTVYYDAVRGLGNRLMSLFARGLAHYAPVLAGPHLMSKFRKSVTLTNLGSQ